MASNTMCLSCRGFDGLRYLPLYALSPRVRATRRLGQGSPSIESVGVPHMKRADCGTTPERVCRHSTNAKTRD